MLYLDTGCLVKLYYPEPETARVASKTAGRRIVFTPLHNLEFTSAMRLKVFRREATDDQVRATLRLVEQDISTGKLIIIDNINGTTLQTAIELANQHSARLPILGHLALFARVAPRDRRLPLDRFPTTRPGPIDPPSSPRSVAEPRSGTRNEFRPLPSTL